MGEFFSTKLTKKCKGNQGWNVLYIRGYDVTYAELCNFIISWNLTKTPQNLVQDFFSTVLTKAYAKKTGGSKLHFFLNRKKKDNRERGKSNYEKVELVAQNMFLSEELLSSFFFHCFVAI